MPTPPKGRGIAASLVLLGLLGFVGLVGSTTAQAQITNTSDMDPPLAGSLRAEVDASVSAASPCLLHGIATTPVCLAYKLFKLLPGELTKGVYALLLVEEPAP